jgi:hypothetical protein
VIKLEIDDFLFVSLLQQSYLEGRKSVKRDLEKLNEIYPYSSEEILKALVEKLNR